MSERRSKQVIVMRKDLNMRKGKMIAQGAHASLITVFSIIDQYETKSMLGEILNKTEKELRYAYLDWVEGSFRKICVYVNSEEELEAVFNKAIQSGLPANIITDEGLTEFKGVPTKTCMAIGPAWEDQIDSVTGHLPLL